MDELNASDPTGIVAKCVRDLIKVGFDASAYEIAKWAGVACLVALLVLIILTFGARMLRDKELAPALSEQQFRLTILIGAVLITLPVVAKIAGDQFNIETGSQDREFAQRVCDERIDNIANDAEVEALHQRLIALETYVETADSTSVPTSEAPRTADPLLGQAISLFHRSNSKSLALQIEAVLQAAGAGVAVEATDLTESSLLAAALPGDIYVLYTTDATETLKAARDLLQAQGYTLKGVRGPFDLKGNPLQILVF